MREGDELIERLRGNWAHLSPDDATEAADRLAALEHRVEALTLTVSVEQGKVAYRDKLIATADAAALSAHKRLREIATRDEAKSVMVGAVDLLALLDENERLREALADAKLQIEYLHDKFRTTGSGIAALARIDAALSA